MKYLVVYLWSSTSVRIRDLVTPYLNGFVINYLKNCQLEMNTYADLMCKKDVNFKIGEMYKADELNEIVVTVKGHLAYILLTANGERRMLVLYYLPLKVLQCDFNYHQWNWETKQPGHILMPNMTNNYDYYVPIRFKPVTVVSERDIKQYTLNDPNKLYINPEITYKFALPKDYQPPITIYDSNNNTKKIVCGQDLSIPGQHKYLMQSQDLDLTHTYYITCNDVISYKNQPIIRLLINVYKNQEIIYSDFVIYRIAPIILTPNCLPVKTVYLSEMDGAQNNHSFLKEVTEVLKETKHDYVIVRNPHISMYHRWMQDIFKFGYFTDGTHIQYIVLQGPHLLAQTQSGADISYIYSYFKNLPIYNFDFSSDRNLDAFGNVQIIPPIGSEYPLGRIIYGISDEETQPNISYNLMSFLEGQQIQKPIRVNTGWLSVGHVDEILSYIPDPNHRLGFRVLIASTQKFYQLINKLPKDQLIFDNKDIYYLFEQADRVPYQHKYEAKDKKQCVYQTKIKTKDLLDWTDLITINQYYQKKLDNIKQIIMCELGLKNQEIYEIPIYYWPKSISVRAKSIMPNMVNNLFIENQLLVPKPFGPNINGVDIFENYFKSCMPKQTKVNFIKNWEAYYLLEGDINCGTNTMRKPFNKLWWSHKPNNSYDI